MPESKTPSIMKPLIAPISILGIVATFLCLSSGQVYGQNTPTPQAQTSIYDQNRLDAFDLQLSSLTHTLANASGGGSWSGGSVSNPSTFTYVYVGSITVTGLQEQWQNNSGANGGTGVRCKTFQSTVISSGTAITYTSDTTNGDKWTINQDGLYSIHLLVDATATDQMGVSQNNQNCTTGIESIAWANILCKNGTSIISGGDLVDCSWTGWLRAGNILHVHQSGATSASGTGNFVITRIY